MRKDPLINGEYYHIYNRGVDKRDIFMNIKDLNRFILSVKEFNTIKPTGGIKELQFKRPNSDHLDVDHSDVGRPLIRIVCYCFNPNHFHFIVKQEVDGGISEFFKRLLGGYTKYFNLINKRSGALFQGRFKSKLIDNDRYFLTIFSYVNLNYLMHDIPLEKNHLVWASDKEYDSDNFNLVSSDEAKTVLDLYDNTKAFKKECFDVINIIRKQRGKTSLLEEDILP